MSATGIEAITVDYALYLILSRLREVDMFNWVEVFADATWRPLVIDDQRRTVVMETDEVAPIIGPFSETFANYINAVTAHATQQQPYPPHIVNGVPENCYPPQQQSSTFPF